MGACAGGSPHRTAVDDVLHRFGVAIAAGDRIVFGGPCGSRVRPRRIPCSPTPTPSSFGCGRAAQLTDYPCINCGNASGSVPRMQINLLVRYLEAGKYEDAEDYTI